MRQSVHCFSDKTPTTVNSNGMHYLTWLSRLHTSSCVFLVSLQWIYIKQSQDWRKLCGCFCTQLGTTHLFLLLLPHCSPALVWINSLVYVCMLLVWIKTTTTTTTTKVLAWRQRNKKKISKERQRDLRTFCRRENKLSFSTEWNKNETHPAKGRYPAAGPHRDGVFTYTLAHMFLLSYLLPATGCLQLHQ